MVEFNIGCCIVASVILFTQVVRFVRAQRRRQRTERLMERLGILRPDRSTL